MALVKTLLSTPEGFKILVEDKLLAQLVTYFKELDQYVGQPRAHPFFSKLRLESTLSIGYFEVIEVLSQNTEGVK